MTDTNLNSSIMPEIRVNLQAVLVVVQTFPDGAYSGLGDIDVPPHWPLDMPQKALRGVQGDVLNFYALSYPRNKWMNTAGRTQPGLGRSGNMA